MARAALNYYLGKRNGPLTIGASLCGIGTSSVFPTNVARFSKTFGSDAMRRATPLFCGWRSSMGSLAGVCSTSHAAPAS